MLPVYMATDGNTIKQLLSNNFYCQICDYNTKRKSNLLNHLNTTRHKTATSGNKNKQILSNNFVCENCNKTYKDRTGLWKHKKKCKCDNDTHYNESVNNKTDSKIHDEISDKELIIMLIKENSEFKNMMMEALENGTYNNSCNTTNSHNKSFNLQFFLNETCKDAMNIMDFVNSIQLQLSDLESVGKLGFVEGISNIITNNLKALDVTQRPVHCTDDKRETIYVKDENKWEKEDDQKNKIRKAIKKIATKNLCLLPKFKDAHPDCNRSSSKFSDQYNKIVIEACGGSGNNDLEKEDKIIRNIAKNVTIDKK
jgi:hypothetical protein